MFFKSKKEARPMRPMTSNAAGALMIMDAMRSMPSKVTCNAIYTALADKKDLKAEDLEELANKLGRLAWDRSRE